MRISQESISAKAVCPQNCNSIWKRHQLRFFPVKFAKYLITTCFREHLQWIHLTASGFQPATLLKQRLRQWCFPVNFANFLRISFDRKSSDDFFLCLSPNFGEVFQNTSLTDRIWETAMYYVLCTMYKLQNFNHQIQYFTGAFQAFYTRTKVGIQKLWLT